MILSVDSLDAVEYGSANDSVCERWDGNNKYNEAHNNPTITYLLHLHSVLKKPTISI